MAETGDNYQDVDFLFELGSKVAASSPPHEVLERVVEFIVSVIKCDSCFAYVLEGDELVLRASKNPHLEVVDRLTAAPGGGHHGVGGRAPPPGGHCRGCL